jgi:hypothetical protein
LKKDVTRLLLFRSFENAVDLLRHGSQLLPSRAAPWQADSPEPAQRSGSSIGKNNHNRIVSADETD